MLSGLQVVGRRTLTHADKNNFPTSQPSWKYNEMLFCVRLIKRRTRTIRFDLSSTFTSFWCESLLLFDLSLCSVFNIHNIISQEFLFGICFKLTPSSFTNFSLIFSLHISQRYKDLTLYVLLHSVKGSCWKCHWIIAWRSVNCFF